MKTFIINEEEKKRILGMHKSASSNHYLKEGGAPYSWAHRSYPVTSIDVTNAPEDKKQVIQNIKNVDVTSISEPYNNIVNFTMAGDGETFLATYNQGKITAKEWDGTYEGVIFTMPELSEVLSKILSNPEGMINK